MKLLLHVDFEVLVSVQPRMGRTLYCVVVLGVETTEAERQNHQRDRTLPVDDVAVSYYLKTDQTQNSVADVVVVVGTVVVNGYDDSFVAVNERTMHYAAWCPTESHVDGMCVGGGVVG